MQTLPLDVSSPNDPTAQSKPDGLCVASCGDDMVVYGGWAADRVWVLHLPSATWSEVVTKGSIPPARTDHATAYYNGHLLMCGGELMVKPEHGFAQFLNYYELALDTFEWMAVECFGAVPTNRSHHTAVVCSDTFVVFGGKPQDGNALTCAALAEAKRTGFFDVFVLQIISRTWRRIEMYDPKSPMLWGHSGVCFRDAYIIFFGGFDVSQGDAAGTPFAQGTTALDAPPAAALSNVTHILNTESMQWMRCTPTGQEDAPVARALHVAQIHRAEMIVFGGFTIDFIGRCLNVNDCWVWSVEFGSWQKIEFCLPAWPSRRLLSCVFESQLVVANQVSSVFVLEMNKRSTGWKRIPCTTTARTLDINSIEFPAQVFEKQRGKVQQRGSGKTSPQREYHNTIMASNFQGIGGMKGQARESSEPPKGSSPASRGASGGLSQGSHWGSAVLDPEVERLRKEIDLLRQQLGQPDPYAQRDSASSSPPLPGRRENPPWDASSPAGRATSSSLASTTKKKALQKWGTAAEQATTVTPPQHEPERDRSIDSFSQSKLDAFRARRQQQQEQLQERRSVALSAKKRTPSSHSVTPKRAAPPQSTPGSSSFQSPPHHFHPYHSVTSPGDQQQHHKPSDSSKGKVRFDEPSTFERPPFIVEGVGGPSGVGWEQSPERTQYGKLSLSEHADQTEAALEANYRLQSLNQLESLAARKQKIVSARKAKVRQLQRRLDEMIRNGKYSAEKIMMIRKVIREAQAVDGLISQEEKNFGDKRSDLEVGAAPYEEGGREAAAGAPPSKDEPLLAATRGGLRERSPPMSKTPDQQQQQQQQQQQREVFPEQRPQPPRQQRRRKEAFTFPSAATVDVPSVVARVAAGIDELKKRTLDSAKLESPPYESHDGAPNQLQGGNSGSSTPIEEYWQGLEEALRQPPRLRGSVHFR